MLRIAGTTSWDELKQRIHNVPLLQLRGGEAIFPYRDAVIELVRVDYAAVQPTSLYVAHTLLDKQKQIAEIIARDGYDPLELDRGLILADVVDGQEVQTGFIPPILERNEADGLYVVDGNHRINLGRWAGRSWFMAIVISNVREDCPFYAHPNIWDEIITYDEPPARPELRKRYRQADLYSLYRDFNELNGGRPRSF